MEIIVILNLICVSYLVFEKIRDKIRTKKMRDEVIKSYGQPEKFSWTT